MKKSRESRVLLILLALVLTLSMQTAGVFGVEEAPADEGAASVDRMIRAGSKNIAIPS